MQSKPKILVTGATGFIGLELSNHLSQLGFRPRLLVRRPSRAPLLQNLDAELVQGDLTSPESLKRACKGVDSVIHLGARAVFEEYDRVRPTIVEGSLHLMEAAAEAGVSHFIYASSLLVYASQETEIDAGTPVQPKCGYGEAKVEAEKKLSERAKEKGIKLGIIRLPHVYGAGDLMFEQVRKGSLFYPGNGLNCFSHLHVHDTARLLTSIALQSWEGVTPVADTLPVNWREYFGEIKKYYPRFRAYSVPEWLALAFTCLYTPIRRLGKKPSVYTPGSVISWNLNLPVKEGLLWRDLNLEPIYPTIYHGIPAVLDECVPYRWVHPINDKQG